MFGIDVSVLVCIALAAVLVGQFVFKKDDEGEKRKSAAIKVAGKLREVGLHRIPNFLERYAIGDLSGMATDLKQLAELFTGEPSIVVKEFDRVFGRVFDIKLSQPEGRAWIAARLAEASKPATPSA